MFTGIIEDVGVVEALNTGPGGARLGVRTRLGGDLAVGQSVAVNGVCLTVVNPTADGFACDVLDETLSRSNLGERRPGARVNLERALRADGRLDGHIVQGHVDGSGAIASIGRVGADWEVRVAAPPEVARYLVFKGSIAIDGISLTIAEADDAGFAVRVIPHTWDATNLGAARPGDRVNLEVDLVAKYVERILGRGRPDDAGDAEGGVTWDVLRRAGFVGDGDS